MRTQGSGPLLAILKTDARLTAGTLQEQHDQEQYAAQAAGGYHQDVQEVRRVPHLLLDWAVLQLVPLLLDEHLMVLSLRERLGVDDLQRSAQIVSTGAHMHISCRFT